MAKKVLGCRRLSSLLVLIGWLGLSHNASAIVVGGGSASDPIYSASGFTGVGFSTVSNVGSCSGSLLNTGMHFLTAAHCILDSNGLASGTANVTFSSGAGTFAYTATAMIANSAFNASNFFGGSDLAIITLSQVVDLSIDRYSLYTSAAELNQIGTLVGYGREGTGNLGGEGGTFGTRRKGQNEIDQILGGNILYYDFDNGNPLQSTLGGNGLGVNEVGPYKGDSGGPTFIGNQIAGIHSFISCIPGPGSTCLSPPDVDTAFNGSFGERFGDTRVSAYVSWINGVIEPITVPEPATYAAGLIAFALCAAKARKTRT